MNIPYIDDSYDPSIQALLDQAEDDWGNQTQNRENLVPYGIKPFDKALYGLDTLNGELALIMGPRKRRKTTFAINIIINYMTSKLPKDKPFTVVDSLESGMRPKRYRDTLIVNLASRIMIEDGHLPSGVCPVCGTQCKELVLNPEYLYYNTRSTTQMRAINRAKGIMGMWPLHIYGANPKQGDTRSLANSIKSRDSRWRVLIEEYGAKIFWSDHAQQYSFETEVSDYEKQLRAVSAIGDIVSQHGIVCGLLSQVSLTSLREARSGSGQLNATGGTKAQEEANVIFSVNYEDGSGEMRVAIEESRKSSTFAVMHPLEDNSGAFYGEPKVVYD